MTPAVLPPELAIAYLRALSVDVRAAAVTDASGVLLAGDRDVLDAPDAVRVADAAHVVAARTGRHAMAAVLAEDLQAVLGALGSTR